MPYSRAAECRCRLVSRHPDRPCRIRRQQPVIARITWDRAPDSSPARYRVYVSQQADGPYAWSEDTTNEEFDFQDGLGGFTYYFRVTAFNSAGEESDFAQAGPVRATWAASSSRLCDHHVDDVYSLPLHSHQLVDPAVSTGALVADLEPTAVSYPCHDGRIPLAANVSQGNGLFCALKWA